MLELNYRDYSVKLVQHGHDWFVSSIIHVDSGAILREPGFDFASAKHATIYSKGLIDSFAAVARVATSGTAALG